MVTPPTPSTDDSNYTLLQAFPAVDPSAEAMGTILGDLRAQLPESALVGGAQRRNLDLQQALNDYLPLVIGIILALRLHPAARRSAGTTDRDPRHRRQFAVDRRSVRVAKLIFKTDTDRRCSASTLKVSSTAGGRCSSSRDDLCHRHGLHRVPARHRERTLREDRGPEGCSGRRPRAHPDASSSPLRRSWSPCSSPSRSPIRSHPRKWASSSASRCCSTPS